jgi:hypothetical protein
MTLAELERLFRSRKRVRREEAQEKASYDYILADLIGISMARNYSKSNKYPDIAEVYPTLFDSQEMHEKRREQQAEVSALRFKQFVNSFNNRFKKKEVAKD